MTNTIGAEHLKMTKAFFEALQDHDKTTLVDLLAADVVEIIPLSLSGSADAQAVFSGREEVLGYLHTIIDNFSRTVLKDQVFTVSEDGMSVFLEASGDLIHAASGSAYHNVYIFKFEFAGGKMARILEYANPVTFGKLVGAPIG